MITSSLYTAALLIITQCLFAGVSCSNSPPGVVTPKDIEIEIGQSQNITCQMDLRRFGGADSRSLTFVPEDTSEEVPKKDILILNSTTIVYMLRNATKQNRRYACMSGNDGVDLTKIKVGMKPPKITDFKCRSYGYVYMVCNFTMPENTIPTQYNVSYTSHSLSYVHKCQLEYHDNQAICNLTSSGNNIYRSNCEVFNFIVVSNNSLGLTQQSFRIQHNESIIPARPGIVIENITTSSALLKWDIVRYSHYRRNLVYEVLIKPENKSWLNDYKDYEVQNRKEEYRILLKNLPYAFYSYTVSVRLKIRSKKAEWSDAFIGNFKTLPTYPASPPSTDSSSYFIANGNQLRLYWKQLPVEDYNGPDFKYFIKQVKVNGVKSDLKPLEIELTSATFEWDRTNSYEFQIKSQNFHGESPKASIITVPAIPKTIDENEITPLVLSNVYNGLSRTYTLSWKLPVDLKNLIDFTVFWCEKKKETFDDCKGSLDFQHVPKEITNFTTSPLEQDQHSLNLAVSANYESFSTGMHWMCALDVSSDLVKLKPDMEAIGPTTIQIRWSLDSCYGSLLEGYNLTYCDLSAKEKECFTQTIKKSDEKVFLLKNLKPFTKYELEMFMFSKQKLGSTSEPIQVLTKEDAPSPPRHLTFKSVTSDSVWLFWKPPETLNGILKFYKIKINGKDYIIKCSPSRESFCNTKNNPEIEYKMENLTSFTDYEVSVVAHTVADSADSESISFKTLIGIPSEPDNLNPTSVNEKTLFEWERPKNPNGRLEFYEVAFTILHNNETQQEFISTIFNATSCLVKLPTCEGRNYSHTLKVRAVNVVSRSEEIDSDILTSYENLPIQNRPENSLLECSRSTPLTREEENILKSFQSSNDFVQFKSRWSKDQPYFCGPPPSIVKAVGSITGGLFLIFGMVVVFHFARKEYYKMSNIKCAIPEALNAVYPTKISKDFDSSHTDDDDDFKKSKDFATTEAHHLLPSFHDSGYLLNYFSDDVMGNGGDGLTPVSLGKSSGYSGSDQFDGHQDYTPDQMFDYKLKENQQKAQQPQDSYTNMQVSKDDLFKKKPPKNDGYMDESQFMKPCHIPSFLPSDNGYIKPNPMGWPSAEPSCIFTVDKTSRKPNLSNGVFGNGGVGGGGDYVPPQMFHKPVNNGYTTLEALGKPQMVSTLTAPSSHTAHNFEGGGTRIDGGGISGYVTPKQLSAFGQKLV